MSEGRKKKLRQELRLMRQKYSPVLKTHEEKKALERLRVWINKHKPQGIHIYLSFGSEFSTTRMVEMVWDESIPLFCPKVTTVSGVLSHHRLSSWTDLERHKLGMLEPKARVCESDHMVVDLILVPGLGFGRLGQRLGYGGGYYDRFLKSTDALKVGLGYGCQLVEDCPVEEHDIFMDEVWIE